jgi:hypothetical protein
MKLTSLLVIIVISFFLISCETGGNNFGPIDENFKEGRGELSLVKGESTFPIKRHQNSAIAGIFVLENKAGYDLENVVVTMLGLDKAFFNIPEEKKNVGTIEGRSLVNRDGGKADVVIEGFIPKLPSGISSKKQNYFLHVTYNSKIEFAPTVCVKGGLYQTGGCDSVTGFERTDSSKPITFTGQGAPLAVTMLEIIPYSSDGSDIEFRMNLNNVGKGKVGHINLNKAALAGSPLKCLFKGGEDEGSNYILMPKEQTIDLVCITKLQSSSPYKTPLYLELFYEYEIRIPQSLEILGSARRN